MVEQAVAEEAELFLGICELLDDLGRSHKRIGTGLGPGMSGWSWWNVGWVAGLGYMVFECVGGICSEAFEQGGVELASLSIEERGNPLAVMSGGIAGFNWVLWCEINHICCDDVERVDGDDFGFVGQVHSFCDGDGDSQACEAARADGNVNLANLGGCSGEALEESGDGGEYLSGVLHGSGKGGFCKEFGADSESDGADSAGGFESQYQWFCSHDTIG